MSPAQTKGGGKSVNMHSCPWQPAANLEVLRARAGMLAQIRQFFAQRGVLEVETPILSQAGNTDPHLASFSVNPPSGGARRYLHTSPEFAMKRLLAAGSGPIYQVARVFRADERGRLHNPEFSMLEWYRPGWDHHQLMDEVDALLQQLTGTPPATRVTYADAFAAHCQIEPHAADIRALREAAVRLDVGLVDAGTAQLARSDWLDLLMSHVVAPALGRNHPVFIYDFPESQAALARVRRGVPAVAERFELFVAGVELANGFHELVDADEQQRRFVADVAARRASGQEAIPIDERLLAALRAGLPPCAGVALGLDRLLMQITANDDVGEVLAFPWERA